MGKERHHRIKSDYGTNDYYRYYKKKSDNPVDRLTYGKVLREFNEHVRDRLSLKGAGYVMPHSMGKIELRKLKQEVTIDDDGNVVNHLPVNWRATRREWKKNPSLKEKGIKIRYTNEHTGGYTFRVVYLRSRATYKNKSIYKMKFNRTLKRQLSKSIFKGNIDAFLNK